jgi:hypothetical protein
MYSENDARAKRAVAEWGKRLREVSKLLVGATPPWLTATERRGYNLWWRDRAHQNSCNLAIKNACEMGADFTFLIFVCYALDEEATSAFPDPEEDAKRREEGARAFELFDLSSRARRGEPLTEQVLAEMRRLKFSDGQMATVLAWAQGTASFLERGDPAAI